MNKSNVIELAGRVESTDPLTELLRSGARQLLQEAIEAEVQELLTTHSDRVLEDGRAGVVRNGHLPRTRHSDRDWSGYRADSQGTGQDGRACDLSLCLGTAVCAQDQGT